MASISIGDLIRSRQFDAAKGVTELIQEQCHQGSGMVKCQFTEPHKNAIRNIVRQMRALGKNENDRMFRDFVTLLESGSCHMVGAAALLATVALIAPGNTQNNQNLEIVASLADCLQNSIGIVVNRS